MVSLLVLRSSPGSSLSSSSRLLLSCRGSRRWLGCQQQTDIIVSRRMGNRRGFLAVMAQRTNLNDVCSKTSPSRCWFGTSSASSYAQPTASASTTSSSSSSSACASCSWPSRNEQLNRLKDDPSEKAWDVLVIGGGATGAGIALDAASRGLKVACLERGDFASETSSRSTKLLWAGLKYLGTAVASLLSPQNLLRHPLKTIREFQEEFHMVMECHQERRYMLQQQAHLCHWVPIAVPIHSWYMSPPPMDHVLFGFFPFVAPLVFKFYDLLSFFSCPPSYILTPKQCEQVFPQLLQKHDKTTNLLLKYCAVFYEGMHNDTRTNLAIALTAAEYGAAIVNHVQVQQLILHPQTGLAEGVIVQDTLTQESWSIRAKKIVLAGGPFTDDLRRLELLQQQQQHESSAASSEQQQEQTSLQPPQQRPAVQGAAGTHIVLPGYFLPRHYPLGLLDICTSDGRFMFVLPWLGHVLVGTTDRKGTAVSLPAPPEEDITWLLQECQKHLNLTIQRSDVLSAWTGWRPLALTMTTPTANDNTNNNDEDNLPPVMSRDHVISENPTTGVLYIAGGKWTTWRLMAEQVVDRIVNNNNNNTGSISISGSGPKSQTLHIPLHGGGPGYDKNLAYRLIQHYGRGLNEDVAEHLAETYACHAWDVCDLAQDIGTPLWPQLGKPLVAGFPYIDAEVIYACRYEYAMTIEDILCRRTRLAFLNKQAAVSAISTVAELMAREHQWTPHQKLQHMKAARLYLESYGGRVPQKADVLLRQASRESPEQLFLTLDRDGSGYIDYEEVAEAVSILGLPLTDEQLTKYFEQMDESGSGRVSSHDFTKWWKRFQTSKAYEQMMHELEHPAEVRHEKTY